MGRPKEQTNGTAVSVALPAQDHAEMERAAARLGLSVAEYLRHLHDKHTRKEGADECAPAQAHPASEIRPYHRTALGTVLCGNALSHLHHAPAQSVDLVMTSPPFGLVRKKSYGNEDAHRYCDWFRYFR